MEKNDVTGNRRDAKTSNLNYLWLIVVFIGIYGARDTIMGLVVAAFGVHMFIRFWRRVR